MKFLIIPGFAKSGTTFLFEQLINSGAPVNIPHKKEVDYFRRGKSLEEYLGEFQTQDPDKVFIDASPLYAHNYDAAISNIKTALKGHEVKIVMCLREGLSRAYSHYMHDISSHFFLYAHAPFSFYSSAALSKYLMPLAPRVKAYLDAFGPEHVSGFGFKSTGPKLREDVLEFLGVEHNWELDFSVNPAAGSSLPRMYYDKDRFLTAPSGKDLYALPPRTWMMASHRFPQYRPDFPADIADQLLRTYSSWDRSFDPARLGAAVKTVQQDYLTCFKHLNMPPETLAESKIIHAKEPPALPKKMTERMEKLGTLQATALNGFAKHSSKTLANFKSEDVAKDAFTSVPEFVKSIEAAQNKGQGARAAALKKAITEMGPVPSYVQGYLRQLITLGDGKAALTFLDQNPNLNRYVVYGSLHSVIKRMKSKFKPDVYTAICAHLGVKTP